MNRLILVGSPREHGRSAALAEQLFEACIEDCPEDEVSLVPVSSLLPRPCDGCDACKDLAAERLLLVEGEQSDTSRCIIDDNMTYLYDMIDACDELIVVSAVYFAGAPAQFKALLDRLQPYYWTTARFDTKRPATLHVVGEGGDPHGFEPLIGVVRSALSCAGFELKEVLNWVGNIDAEGRILADATSYPLPSLPRSVRNEVHGH